jgi:hypothetical protein
MVSICLCILWALLVTLLLPNAKQPTGVIVSAIGAVLIAVICIQLGIK